MGEVSEAGSLQQRENQLDGAEKVRPKNKYAAPRLVEYGSLAKLTRGAAAGGTEGPAMSAACL